MDLSGPTVPAADVDGLSGKELDRLLEELEGRVPRRPPLVHLGPEGPSEALVFGDSHGDWRSVEELVGQFLADPGRFALVGLGDYIDRGPDDCPSASVANALALLGLAARFPDRVYLLTGNHELTRRLGASPHTLPRELERRWGRDPRRYARLMSLLERGPLAAVTESGAFLAHAGFPRSLPLPLRDGALGAAEDALLLDLTWSEPDALRHHRGGVPRWGHDELARFLDGSGLTVLLRGHDAELTGRPIYDGRCLTLHTCRLYERFFGVVFATLPLAGRVRSTAEVRVEHLSTEGRTFPGPERAAGKP